MGLTAGLIVDQFGYSAAFNAASAIAATAVFVLLAWTPETRKTP